VLNKRIIPKFNKWTVIASIIYARWQRCFASCNDGRTAECWTASCALRE